MNAHHTDPVRPSPDDVGDHEPCVQHDAGGVMLKLLLLLVGLSVASAVALAVFVLVMRR